MILDSPEKDLIVDATDGMSDEQMIDILSEKVQAYLDVNISLLLSYLYRLDVREDLIKEALANSSDEPGNRTLAKLIWKRQKQRLESKKSTKIDKLNDEDLAW